MEEIAGLSEVQLRHVYFRRRGKYGQLLRGRKYEEAEDGYLPPLEAIKAAGGAVSYKEVFFADRRRQSAALIGQVLSGPGVPKRLQGKPFTGLNDKDIERHWQAYLKENPALGDPAGLPPL